MKREWMGEGRGSEKLLCGAIEFLFPLNMESHVEMAELKDQLVWFIEILLKVQLPWTVALT